MIGKLFGAWLGEKVAGRNEGAKGAIRAMARRLAKRSVPRSRRSRSVAGLGNGATVQLADYPSEGSESFDFALGRLLEIRLDLALKLERHRLAVAVAAAAGGNADPAFRNRIFDDVGLFLAVELDPDAALKQRLVEISLRGSSERRSGGVSWGFGHGAPYPARSRGQRRVQEWKTRDVKDTCHD